MTTGKDICTWALTMIGDEPIPATEPDDPESFAGAEPRVIACKALYAAKRDALLMRHPWKFASQDWHSDYEDQIYTITGATQADPVAASIASHPFQVGQYVLVDGVVGMTELNGETLRISAKAAGTISLDIDGTAFTAYASGGTARIRPPFQFEYGHILPSDFMHDVGLYDSDEPYLVKKGVLYTNESEINLQYIAKETDVSLFNAMFIEALAAFMGIDLSKRVADSRKWSAECRSAFNQAIFQAMQRDAFIGAPKNDRPTSDWQTAGR